MKTLTLIVAMSLVLVGCKDKAEKAKKESSEK